MSQASWSSPTSQSSLTRRISETTRASSASRLASPATSRSTTVGHAAVHPGLADAGEGRRQVVDVAHREAERGRHLVQRGAAAGPQLAVLPVAEELVGVARGARPGVEHRLAVLDDQDGVAGLVAGEVGVRGVRRGTGSRCRWTAPCRCPAGSTSRSPGNASASAARRRAAWSATGCRGRSSSRSPQPVRMNALPGLGDLRVVRLGLGGGGLGGGLLAHALTVRRAAGRLSACPDRLPPCPDPPRQPVPSRSW